MFRLHNQYLAEQTLDLDLFYHAVKALCSQSPMDPVPMDLD